MLVEQSTLQQNQRYVNIRNLCWGALFMENVPLSTDKNGYYFIDRCGHIFQYILQFLRCGKLVLPQGFNELELLKVEADFYQIEGLISAVSAVEHRKTKVEVKEWDETPVLLFSILHYQNIIRSIKDMKLFIKSRGIGFELIDCKLDINNRDENGVRTYLQSDGWVLKEQKTLEKIEASVFFCDPWHRQKVSRPDGKFLQLLWC